MKAHLSKRADADLDEIKDYIAKDNSASADDVVSAILSTVALLEKQPKAGGRVRFKAPHHLGEVRYMPTTGYRNYLVFYRILEEEIEVTRILEGSRDLIARLFE